MAYELKQELKLTQKLSLTPQLQLAIKLLQLSRQELLDVVKEEVEVNPVLDENVEADLAEASPNEVEKNELDWQQYLESQDESFSKSRLDFSKNDNDGLIGKEVIYSDTLKQHLTSQLKFADLNVEEEMVGEFIIGNIDDNGYLRILDDAPLVSSNYELARKDAVQAVSVLLNLQVEMVECVLTRLQEFDPAGVVATSTAECLYLQALRLPIRDTLVEEIVKNHLGLLALKNYKAISKETGADTSDIMSAAQVVRDSLNPMLGGGFEGEVARAVVPDVFIRKVEGEYAVFLNDDGLPRLKISPYYKKLLGKNGKLSEEAKGYVQERFRSASWLIKCIQQRQSTIKKVVESIVKYQGKFLDNGLRSLKPMVLREVAEDIEMHESTVSRVTTNKYVDTPRGVFELKYFFSTAMSKTDGSDVSAEYVKEKVRKLIENEDVAIPLSDQQIAHRLKAFDMLVARRTVAKYREELGFLSSSKRKSRF